MMKIAIGGPSDFSHGLSAYKLLNKILHRKR